MGSESSTLSHSHNVLQYAKLFHSSFEHVQMEMASIIFILKIGNERPQRL